MTEAKLYDENNKDMLNETYNSFISAVLDPTSHMKEEHSFQLKSFAKPIQCDHCMSIMSSKLFILL